MKNEQLKERVISNIKTGILSICQTTNTDIYQIMIVISHELQNINMSEDKELPSVDVIDNYKICKNFLATKKIEGLSDNTITAYKYSIKKMLSYFNCDVKDITTNDLRIFFAEYNKTTSLVTVDNMRRNLNSFFQWLEDENYIDKNPCKKVKKIKSPQKIKTPLSTVEIEKIRDCCLKDNNSRNLALIDLLLSTGARCEEVTNIKLSDCDFENKNIKIHGKGSKDRVVYMSERCRMHLVQYLNQRTHTSEYLFCNNQCNKLTTEGLSHIMREIGNKAGVEKCQIHRFRKYFASSLFRKGCDIIYVQKLLGHAKLDTTKKHYLQVEQDCIHNEFDKFAA